MLAAISDPQTSMRLVFVSAAPAWKLPVLAPPKQRRRTAAIRTRIAPFWLHRESLAVGSLPAGHDIGCRAGRLANAADEITYGIG